MFPISGNWNLPVGPLAGQMYAHTCDHCGLVLEAEGSEVQTEEWYVKPEEVTIHQRCGEKEHKGEQTDLICCWCRVKMAETESVLDTKLDTQEFRYNKITLKCNCPANSTSNKRYVVKKCTCLPSTHSKTYSKQGNLRYNQLLITNLHVMNIY